MARSNINCWSKYKNNRQAGRQAILSTPGINIALIQTCPVTHQTHKCWIVKLHNRDRLQLMWLMWETAFILLDWIWMCALSRQLHRARKTQKTAWSSRLLYVMSLLLNWPPPTGRSITNLFSAPSVPRGVSVNNGIRVLMTDMFWGKACIGYPPTSFIHGIGW